MATKKKTSKKKRQASGKNRLSAEQKYRLFVEAYLANGQNATQAAISAGYSEKSARVTGSQLLAKPNIQAMIKARQEKLAKKFELTTESVIAELAKIVHADPRKLFSDHGTLLPPSQWPDEMAGAVAGLDIVESQAGPDGEYEFTKKLKFWDKNSAIEKAMKHLGLFERDNQQQNPLSDLPREVVQLIQDKLRASLKS